MKQREGKWICREDGETVMVMMMMSLEPWRYEGDGLFLVHGE